MEISDIRVRLVKDTNDRLKAVCSVTLDEEFVVRDVKVVEGTHGLFVAMPSRKLSVPCPKCRTQNHLRARHCNECGGKLPPPRIPADADGREKAHRDIAHPITSAFRQAVQTRVLDAYRVECEEVDDEGQDTDAGDSDAPDTGVGDVSDASVSDTSDTGVSDTSDTGVSDTSDTGVSDASDTGDSDASDTGVSDTSDTGVSDASDASDSDVDSPVQQVSDYDALIGGLKGRGDAPRGRDEAGRSGGSGRREGGERQDRGGRRRGGGRGRRPDDEQRPATDRDVRKEVAAAPADSGFAVSEPTEPATPERHSDDDDTVNEIPAAVRMDGLIVEERVPALPSNVETDGVDQPGSTEATGQPPPSDEDSDKDTAFGAGIL